MPVVITDLGNDIQFDHNDVSGSLVTSYTLNKLTMRLKQDSNGVTVTNSDSYNQGKDNKVIELTSTIVSSPVYADNDALFSGLLGMISGVSLGSSGGGGGGSSTWSTKQRDFTATPTTGTANITIAGLSWTPEAENVSSIVKYSSSGDKETLNTSNIVVSGGVITLGNEDNFESGDTVSVVLEGPDKAYDQGTDSKVVTVINPNDAHFTSPEALVAESNLGIDGAQDDGASGDDAAFFTDDGEVFTAATVAEGYRIYNVTDGSDALINADTLEGHAGDGGAGDDEADEINHAALANGTGDDWDDGDVASIPEVKRFVIPAGGYNFDAIHVFLDSQDDHNSCYLKFYGTLFSEATDADTIWWEDLTEEVFNVATVTADGIGDAERAVTLALGVINLATPMLKFMVEIVAECNDGVQDNEFKVRLIKSS